VSLFVIIIMWLPHAIQDVGLFCTNPLCHQPSRKKFKNETGLMLHLYHFQGCMEWIISGGTKDSFPAQKSNRSKSTCSLVRNFVNPNYPFCQDISNPVSGNSESRLNQANDKRSIHIEKLANHDSVTDEGNNDREDAIPSVNNNTEEDSEVFANTLLYSTDQKWSIALLKVLEDIMPLILLLVRFLPGLVKPPKIIICLTLQAGCPKGDMLNNFSTLLKMPNVFYPLCVQLLSPKERMHVVPWTLYVMILFLSCCLFYRILTS
jgi:hypothetical protein